MINTLEQFGHNAGLVWDALNNYGSLTLKQLLDLTHLRSYEIHIAIGWLACEKKISFIENKFFLSETNLTDSIGINAGLLWKALYESSDKNISELLKDTNIKKEEIYEALGWLAREDKIDIAIKK